MVELRKRKAPAEPAPPALHKKKSNIGKPGARSERPPSGIAVGSKIDLDSFGGEIETNEGQKTTLKELVEESEGGVVLFTYPKASTPGCECFLPGGDRKNAWGLRNN
jgi:thioredoxin-dependent peroxiredoxin